MNMCIQAILEETLMTLMGMFRDFHFFVLFRSISSLNNYSILMLGVPLRIFYFYTPNLRGEQANLERK